MESHQFHITRYYGHLEMEKKRKMKRRYKKEKTGIGEEIDIKQ